VLDSTQRCVEPDSNHARNGPDILWVVAYPRYEGWDKVLGGLDTVRRAHGLGAGGGDERTAVPGTTSVKIN